jgi:hypothetical protein
MDGIVAQKGIRGGETDMAAGAGDPITAPFLEERAARVQLMAVVSRTCGPHVQFMSSAELAAWAHIDGLDSSDSRHGHLLWRS